MVIDAKKLQDILDAGWTKAEFAEVANMSRSTLDAILATGKINRPKHFKGILAAFELKPEFAIPEKELVLEYGNLKGKFNQSTINQSGQGNSIGSKNFSTLINSDDQEKQALLNRIEELQNEKKNWESEKEKLLNIIEILSKK